jgi:hypothetical protein
MSCFVPFNKIRLEVPRHLVWSLRRLKRRLKRGQAHILSRKKCQNPAQWENSSVCRRIDGAEAGHGGGGGLQSALLGDPVSPSWLPLGWLRVVNICACPLLRFQSTPFMLRARMTWRWRECDRLFPMPKSSVAREDKRGRIKEDKRGQAHILGRKRCQNPGAGETSSVCRQIDGAEVGHGGGGWTPVRASGRSGQSIPGDLKDLKGDRRIY